MRGGVRKPLVLAGISAAAAALGGCQLSDSGTNVVNGKQQFLVKCGSCHVLARAGSNGVTGPNLDEAFQRARKDGFGESTFEGVVHHQILYPAIRPQYDPETGKKLSLMPAKLVQGEDAEDVAAYVAFAAARPGKDSGALAQAAAAKPKGTAKAKNGVLDIPANAEGLTIYTFADAEAPPGPITISSKNDAPVDHNIAIDGGGLDEQGQVVKDGGTSEIKVTLKAGEYSFYCSVDGHRQAGMEGKLTVK